MSPDATPMNGLFDAEFFDVESIHVKDGFRIFVGLPAGADPSARYPVILTLDGNASFASTLGTAPEPGAEAFLRFLREELKPLLASRYPVDTDDCSVIGVSLGGLFGAWALLNAPETFRRYILVSPAIWWRNEQFRDWEREFAANHEDLVATVFVGAGALEVAEHLRADALNIAAKNPAMKEAVEAMVQWNDENGWPEVARLVPEFAAKLTSRRYPGLRLQSCIMPEENHLSAPPGLVSRGLHSVVGGRLLMKLPYYQDSPWMTPSRADHGIFIRVVAAGEDQQHQRGQDTSGDNGHAPAP